MILTETLSDVVLCVSLGELGNPDWSNLCAIQWLTLGSMTHHALFIDIMDWYLSSIFHHSGFFLTLKRYCVSWSSTIVGAITIEPIVRAVNIDNRKLFSNTLESLSVDRLAGRSNCQRAENFPHEKQLCLEQECRHGAFCRELQSLT